MQVIKKCVGYKIWSLACISMDCISGTGKLYTNSHFDDSV